MIITKIRIICFGNNYVIMYLKITVTHNLIPILKKKTMSYLCLFFIMTLCFYNTNAFILIGKKSKRSSLLPYVPKRLPMTFMSMEPNQFDAMLNSSEFLFTIFSIQFFLYLVIVVEKFTIYTKSLQ